MNELEKNTQKEENEVKDADQKNTQEEKNEVNNADDKNTQEEKNEVKDTDDKNTQEEKNEVKDSDEKNTQEEKVKAEVKVSEDKKKRVPMDTEDKDDPETCQPRKKAKKTFANRAPPKTEGPYIQWAAMKHAYEKGNAPIPTVNEGKFYNYCREKSEAEGAEVAIELRAEVYKSSALALYQQWMAERMEAAPLLE